MRHNRKLLAILLLCALAVCAFSFAGCHRHNKYGYERVEATCTEDGYIKIWCDEDGFVHEDECETLPKKGHRFDADGYCEVCGDPDLTNPAFGSSDDGLGLTLTEKGVLSWNRLPSASKYELSITYFGQTEPTVYTFDKKTVTAKLDDLDKQNPYDYDVTFPSGKCSAKLTPYTIHKETVDGEKIEVEYPISELVDEFKIIKSKGNFGLVRMTYSDENLTLKGFYSDVKTDEEDNPYYLYEVLLKNNKSTQVNIKNCVRLNSGCSANYYPTAHDRSANMNAINDINLRLQYAKPREDTVLYVRVTLAKGGYKDYDLCVRGLMTLTLGRYNITSTTDSYGFREDKLTQIGDDIVCTEGDIIPLDIVFAGAPSSTARDENYNLIKNEKAYEFVMNAPAIGDSVAIYFGNSVTGDCNNFKYWSDFYTLTRTANSAGVDGWYLSADSTKKEMREGSGDEYLPYKICGKRVFGYAFDNVNATTLCIPKELTTLNISFTNCEKLMTVRISNPSMYIPKGAFEGANDNLVIRCSFSSSAKTEFASGWNEKRATGAYAGEFTVIYSG